ncbi:metal-dependent hydrolase [Phytohalomonas tamaricis]|uniref:metal-dependent hydrolase n=1 Tax=Phytohalomonas tamaricis TaxID=2081032 RepID=UPI000D0B6312|nr:metal-dependent hydrolase [Phytohalomonas tamaricis]
MDSLTQACLGGTIGGIVLGRRLGRKSVIAGALLATLPDLDSFIDYGNAVTNYTYHRSFSHSLLVLTVVATLLAFALSRWRRTRKYASLRRWWWFCMLVLITHPLLDAFTTYGTQLLWPLTLPPIAWKTIFIIDPLYTLPLLIASIIFLIRGYAPRALKIGLGLSCAYLMFTVGAKAYVLERVTTTLAQHHVPGHDLMIQPTPFNTLLWRVTMIEGKRQREAFVSLFDAGIPPRFDTYTRHAELAAPALSFDAGQRLSWFAGPFLRYGIEDNRLIVSDIRMGLPGAYSFSFAVAERDTHNQWLQISAAQRPASYPNAATLKLLMKRIIDPHALCPGDISSAALLIEPLSNSAAAKLPPCQTDDTHQFNASPHPS